MSHIFFGIHTKRFVRFQTSLDEINMFSASVSMWKNEKRAQNSENNVHITVVSISDSLYGIL